MHQQKGFTFIELVVVVAIIAVISGIVVPTYLNLKPTIHINGAARQIMGDLMWARMKTVSENNDYVIAFGKPKANPGDDPDLSNNTYYIYDDNDNDFITVGPETSELVKTIVIPNDYKGAGYGFVDDIRDTDDSEDLETDDDLPVTFSSGSTTKPIWFRFRPNGQSNIPGTIYIALDDDLANDRKGRLRAISVTTAGKVKIWSYNQEDDKWQ